MTDITLKRFGSDFRVSESLVTAAVDAYSAESPFQYFRLTKRGYTTFEAVDIVADFLNLPTYAVGYAGLKDEDAITEQYLSVAAKVEPPQLDRFNGSHNHGHTADQPFLELRHHSYNANGLEAGHLDGNSFRIIVRDIDEATADRLSETKGRNNFFFINYYDTQRFGVPDGPKQTHLIGEAVLAKDYERAFTLLAESQSPEAKKCMEHRGTPEQFFADLDQRRVAFYLSAHSSAQWNRVVMSLVDRWCGDNRAAIHRHGIEYLFPSSAGSIRRILASEPETPYDSYRWRDGEMVRYASRRPVVMQTQIRVTDVSSDDLTPGGWCGELMFFLSSGCYATTAVSQFFHQLRQQR
jgi:tRNA pseudouridine13 synthase